MKKKTVQKSRNAQQVTNSQITDARLVYFILFCCTILLYGHTATFGFGFDDSYITDTLAVLKISVEGLFSVFSQKFGTADYRPIVILSFWIERFVFGGFDPGISHFVNVLIFVILLIKIYQFIILCNFFEDPKKNQILAFLSAIFFLIHPVHVGVVANLKSRDNLFSMLFGIMSTIQFIKLLGDKKWWRIIWIIIFLALGYLSKKDCYVFVFIPVLYLLIYKKINYKKILISIVSAIILLIIVSTIKDKMFANLVSNTEVVSRVVIDSPLYFNDSPINRLSMSCTTMLYYFKFLVVPFGYYFFFGYNQIPILPLLHPLNLLSIAIYLSLFVSAIYYYKKNKIYLFSFMFFMLSIAYASNLLIAVAGIVMDRYSFIASLGFCLALSAIFIDLTNSVNWQLFKNKWLLLIIFILVCFTVYRTTAWKDLKTLILRDIKHLDNSAHAQVIAASIYLNPALFDKMEKFQSDEYISTAEKYLDNALRINRLSPAALTSKGICELYRNRSQNAVNYFSECMKLDSNYLAGINYLGVAYRNLNQTDSAYYYFNYVTKRQNQFSYSADNLLLLLINNNRYGEADSVAKELLIRFPEDNNLTQKIYEYKLLRKNNF